MPEIPDVAAFELPPDWICDVLSPSTQALDRADKMPIYGTFGVNHVWLVDPLAQLLETYRLEGKHYLLLGTWHGDAIVNVEPFEVFGLELRVLWER